VERIEFTGHESLAWRDVFLPPPSLIHTEPSSRPGIDQVNVRLSPGLPNRVALEIDGAVSNAVEVQFR
jgi:hypothetical protein